MTAVVVMASSLRVIPAVSTTSVAAIAHLIVAMSPVVVATVSMLTSWALAVVSLSVAVGDKRPVSVLHLNIGLTSLALRLILTHLITDLTSCATSAKLALWLEAVIPVNANNATIEDRSVQSVDSKSSFLAGGILDKAEATGLHLHPVEAHDQIDYLTTRRKELQELALKSEKREVSHVESRRCPEPLSVFFLSQSCSVEELG